MWRGDLAIVQREAESVSVRSIERDHLRRLSDRTVRRRGVVVDERGDVAVVSEPVRVAACVLESRESQRPVGKLESKRVPPLRPPPLPDPSALEHDVLHATLRELVAHREPCLAPSDHDRVVMFPHRTSHCTERDQRLAPPDPAEPPNSRPHATHPTLRSPTPYTRAVRGVAQPGSAPALGAGGRGFESRLPDSCDVARHPVQPNPQSGFGWFRFPGSVGSSGPADGSAGAVVAAGDRWWGCGQFRPWTVNAGGVAAQLALDQCVRAVAGATRRASRPPVPCGRVVAGHGKWRRGPRSPRTGHRPIRGEQRDRRCSSGALSTLTATALQMIAPSSDGRGTCPVRVEVVTGTSSVGARAWVPPGTWSVRPGGSAVGKSGSRASSPTCPRSARSAPSYHRTLNAPVANAREQLEGTWWAIVACSCARHDDGSVGETMSSSGCADWTSTARSSIRAAPSC